MNGAVDRGSAIRTLLDLPLAEHEKRAVQRGFVLQIGRDGRLMVSRLGMEVPPDQLLEVLRDARVRPRAQVLDFPARRQDGRA